MSDGGTSGRKGREEGDEPGAPPPLDDAELASRRAALNEKLAARRALAQATSDASESRSSGMRGMAEGLKIASEFAAGIIVGGGLGYVIDKAAGTSPFGLVVFLMLGFAAGVLNVLRAVSPKKPSPGEGTPSDPPRER